MPSRSKQTVGKANPEKTRLLAKARRLSEQLRRYAAFGYVTRFEDYAKDDRRVLRGIDGLYDLARKHGLAEDPDVQQYRLELRKQFTDARERAQNARSQYYQALSGSLKPKLSEEGRRHLAEWDLSEAQRRAKRGNKA